MNYIILYNKPKYKNDVYSRLLDVYKQDLLDVYKQDLLHQDHIKFFENMKTELNFEPKVCYDIDSIVLH